MNRISRTTFSVAVLLSGCLFVQAAHAELWPTLEKYVDQCVLIVKCKTDMQNVFRYKVLETWKGKYSPDLFDKQPPNGYIFADGGHGNDNPKAGRELVFFFTMHNQPSSGKLQSHSTAFPIEDGKIVYASTNNNLRKEYTVKDFKAAISKIVRQQREQSPAAPDQLR